MSDCDCLGHHSLDWFCDKFVTHLILSNCRFLFGNFQFHFLSENRKGQVNLWFWSVLVVHFYVYLVVEKLIYQYLTRGHAVGWKHSTEQILPWRLSLPNQIHKMCFQFFCILLSVLLFNYLFQSCWSLPSVLWCCWLGGRKGIRPVKNGVVGCWCGYLSGARVQTCIWPSWCHCHTLSLATVKSRLVIPFWYWLTRVVPGKGPLNGCVCFKVVG